jgi:hypothetical protein
MLSACRLGFANMPLCQGTLLLGCFFTYFVVFWVCEEKGDFDGRIIKRPLWNCYTPYAEGPRFLASEPDSVIHLPSSTFTRYKYVLPMRARCIVIERACISGRFLARYSTRLDYIKEYLDSVKADTAAYYLLGKKLLRCLDVELRRATRRLAVLSAAVLSLVRLFACLRASSFLSPALAAQARSSLFHCTLRATQLSCKPC